MNNYAGRVVVGYDGSVPAAAAVSWAATEAERRGRPLTVLHVVDYLGLIPSPMGPFGWPDVQDDAVARVARTGVELARADAKTIDIEAVTLVAKVAGSLIEVSGQAELLVVGTRGRGDPAAVIFGSVAYSVSAHSRCPVVVVRGDTGHPAAGRPVVVGVDGSPRSDEAVRYAADVAAACHAPLTIVSAYRNLASQAWAEAAYPDLEAVGRPDFDTVARESARTAVSAATRIVEQAYPELELTEEVLEGPPAGMLQAVAQGAGLVVVGSRGHGGFAGLLLGSVGHALIHTAPCPVAVLHG